MILDLLRPQLWWILQLMGCIGVYIAFVPSRTLGLCWKSYLFYLAISITTCSWMFLKSFELAPSFLQAWFIGTAGLAICGFLGSMFYFGETISIVNYIGAAITLVGAVLLIL